VFDLARKDVSGFEVYASRISRMFGAGSETLNDLLEGLFHIALADGFYHPNENAFLQQVSEIFGISDVQFRALRARHVPDQVPDPYTVLGVSQEMPLEDIKKVWRGLVRECHPDRMIARGVPEEAIKMAQNRLIRINNAYDEILGSRG
jgi:DnaJ like chaperone protein